MITTRVTKKSQKTNNWQSKECIARDGQGYERDNDFGRRNKGRERKMQDHRESEEILARNSSTSEKSERGKSRLWKMATWNVRGILGKEEKLLEECENAKLNVPAICQTKKNESGIKRRTFDDF